MPFPRIKLELVGNLGRDAEMRYTPQGQPVTTFSLAVSRQWEQNGEKKKETSWYSCTAWGDKLAEAAARLAKGQQVLVIGYLKPDPTTGGPRIWSKQDGTPGTSYELTCQEVWLSILSGGSGEHAPRNDYNQAPDDEIPF